jgi:serine palmitoyltransferase
MSVSPPFIFLASILCTHWVGLEARLSLVCDYHWQEIDELVDEWQPEPLAQSLSLSERHDLSLLPIISKPVGPKPKLLSTGKQVINLTSFNFTGLAGNEEIKERAVETLRKYGLGSCGPPGFYGTLG